MYVSLQNCAKVITADKKRVQSTWSWAMRSPNRATKNTALHENALGHPLQLKVDSDAKKGNYMEWTRWTRGRKQASKFRRRHAISMEKEPKCMRYLPSASSTHHEEENMWTGQLKARSSSFKPYRRDLLRYVSHLQFVFNTRNEKVFTSPFGGVLVCTRTLSDFLNIIVLKKKYQSLCANYCTM